MSENNYNVDLVNLETLSAFFYTQDIAYKQFSEQIKNYKLSQHIEDLKTRRKPKSRDITPSDLLDASKLFKMLIKNCWDNFTQTSIIDVGCNYGIFSMDIAAFIKQNGHKNKIYAFDCGIAGNLCRQNINLNLLDDIIIFEKKAVSNFSIPQLVFADPNYTNDNHIVKRRWGNNLPSFVVDGITLDDYFQNKDENYIIKIDTQGVEPLIFEGMQKMIKKSIVYFEFIPDIINSLSINPIDFLISLPDNCVFYEFQHPKTIIRKIERHHFQEFVKPFLGTGKYTDVLMIPNDVLGYEKIIKIIEESQNFIRNPP